MAKILEVIVTSVSEAREAEAGGADRLELVRDLDCGGLSPETSVIESVLSSASIPVRVMLRENAGMSAGPVDQRNRLRSQAEYLFKLRPHGVVLGFVTDGYVDTSAMSDILSALPSIPVTFHRAFESLASPESAIETLIKFPQIDRVLVRAGPRFPFAVLREWQALAAHRIRFIVGIGLASELMTELKHDRVLSEVHVGRLVREPAHTWGRLERRKVAELKSALT